MAQLYAGRTVPKQSVIRYDGMHYIFRTGRIGNAVQANDAATGASAIPVGKRILPKRTGDIFTEVHGADFRNNHPGKYVSECRQFPASRRSAAQFAIAVRKRHDIRRLVQSQPDQSADDRFGTAVRKIFRYHVRIRFAE